MTDSPIYSRSARFRRYPGDPEYVPFARMTLDQQREYIIERTTPEPNTGCWLWLLCTNRDGYGLAFVPNRRGQPAHKLAYQLFVGPIPDDRIVCHTCDTPLCCNPRHLFWGTCSDNMQDMVSKGRAPGPRDTSSKLTPELVREIRTEVSKGTSLRQIANRLGLSRTSVRLAARRKTWKHVA